MAETSLAALFASVKSELANKPKVKPQRTVRLGYKRASNTILDDKVANDGDEWALGVNELTATLVEAIEWRPLNRVVLMQHWVCSCGHHGTNRLGQFMKELNGKSRTERLRNVGIKFDADAFTYPLVAQWLDSETVDCCNSCAEDAWVREAYQHSIFDQPPTPPLIETCYEVLVSMLVAKPGHNKFGARDITKAVTDREKHEPGPQELAAPKPWRVSNPEDFVESDE